MDPLEPYCLLLLLWSSLLPALGVGTTFHELDAGEVSDLSLLVSSREAAFGGARRIGKSGLASRADVDVVVGGPFEEVAALEGDGK